MSAWNCMDEGRRMEHQQPCMGARIYSCIAWWLRSYLAPLTLPGKFVASLVTIPQLCEEDLKLIPNQPRSCVGREQNWLYCEHSMSVLKHEIALWVYPKLANVLDKMFDLTLTYFWRSTMHIALHIQLRFFHGTAWIKVPPPQKPITHPQAIYLFQRDLGFNFRECAIDAL